RRKRRLGRQSATGRTSEYRQDRLHEVQGRPSGGTGGSLGSRRAAAASERAFDQFPARARMRRIRGCGLVYDAFISYSHSADGQLAPALQRALHRFAKPWWKLRAVNVFRDGTSLAAAHDLSEAITSALLNSRFFILLAAPGASASKWCQREIETWLRHRSP